jgi:hypothetical protein
LNALEVIALLGFRVNGDFMPLTPCESRRSHQQTNGNTVREHAVPPGYSFGKIRLKL